MEEKQFIILLNNIMNTFSKILIGGLIVILGLVWFNNRINTYKNETIIQKLEDSLSKKVDTFLVMRDTAIHSYKQSKKIIVKYDTIYKPGKDSVCDSLVMALKNSLNKCDTVINVSDTLIKTLLIRDTIRQEHIKYLKDKSIFSTVIGTSVGVTPKGIQPSFGVTFGIRIK